MKFVKGITVAEKMPADTPMHEDIVTLPPTPNEYDDVNIKARELIKQWRESKNET